MMREVAGSACAAKGVDLGRSDVRGVCVQGQPVLACFGRGSLRVTGLGESDDPGMLGDRIASPQRGESNAFDAPEHRRVLIKHGADGCVSRTGDPARIFRTVHKFWAVKA